MTNWQFSSHQRDSIKHATAPINIWHGAVRSGKTVASMIAWLLFVRDAPEGDLLMVGKTERTLVRNILNPLSEIVGTKNYHLNKGSGELTLFNKRVYIVGANDERAEQKIRGMTLAGAYGDELTLFPQSFYDMLMTRLSVRGARFLGTTNPASPRHWLKVGVIDKAGGDIHEFAFRLEHNLALSPEYIKRLSNLYAPGTLFHRRMIEGEWVVAEGAVYDFFDQGKHVKPLPSQTPSQYIVSIDYGTANAFVAGLMRRYEPPANGVKFALDRTLYYDGRTKGAKTDAQYLDMLIKWLGDAPVSNVVIDPSALSFKTLLLQAGFNVISAKNDVSNGIRTTAAMLENGEFILSNHPSNAPVITEFGGYLWDSKAQERGEDKPIKQSDHALDAIRYCLFTLNTSASLEQWRKSAGLA